MAGNDGRKAKERLAESLKAALGATQDSTDAEYGISEAFAAPERRKLRGTWIVETHSVGGEDYLEGLNARAVKGRVLREARYESSYRFEDALLVKRARVSGLVDADDGEEPYLLEMGLVLAWEPAPGGSLRLRPELGYLRTALDDETVAFRELGAEGLCLVSYRFEDGFLILSEDDDLKRLRRLE